MKYIVLKDGSRTDKCLGCSRPWGTVSHTRKGLCRGCSRRSEYRNVQKIEGGETEWSANVTISEDLKSLLLENQVDPFKLSRGSKVEITHKCNVCYLSKSTPFKLFVLSKNLSHPNCKIQKTRATNMQKYGTLNVRNQKHLIDAKQSLIDQRIIESFESKSYNVLEIVREDREIFVHFECPQKHKHKITSKAWEQGQRCGLCFGSERINIEVVTEAFKAANYQLLSKSYLNNIQKLEFICDKGHSGETYWKIWTRGIRCTSCPRHSSRGEDELRECLQQFSPVKDRKILKGKELDIWIPSKNVAIEYCGLYWHSDKHDRMTQSYHHDKMNLCEAQGIRLITLFEDEWIDKKEICLSRIRHILGATEKKLDARKCNLKEAEQEQAINFLNSNHLDGCSDSFERAFGLFFEEELVAVAVVGSQESRKMIELKRFACLLDHHIRGAVSKLFSAVRLYAESNGYEEIHTLCDRRWGVDQIYKQLGFELHETISYSSFYTDGRIKWTDPTKVNKNAYIYKIYDCGYKSWKFILNK